VTWAANPILLEPWDLSLLSLDARDTTLLELPADVWALKTWLA